MHFNTEDSPITAMFNIDGESRTYRCRFSACNNPTCTCSNLVIFLFQGQSKKPLHTLEIDVKKRKPARLTREPPSAETKDFTKQLVAQLEEDDFQFLSTMHFEYKCAATEGADLKTIKASFNVKAIEAGRQMYTYQEVLPFSRQFTAMIDDKPYLFLDYYCLCSTCDCTNVVLALFTEDRIGKKAKEHCLVRVDYKKKKWTMDKDFTSAVSVDALQNAAEQQIELFYSELEARHLKLKTIYLHNSSGAPQQVLPPSLKVGRNEPCPCGSGKKYKKCCLQNQAL